MRRGWPRLSTLLCVAILLCVLVPFALRGRLDDLLPALLGGLRGFGMFGAAAYVLAQFLVSATGVLPASLLGLAAGAAYGFWWGAAFAVLGTLAGAIAGFHLGRRGLRGASFLPERLTRSLARAEGYVVADGWKSVFLIRLSPVMPFAATSIALGASRVGERNYLIGTSASLPALCGYVYAGSLFGGGSMLSPRLHNVVVIGLAIGVVAGVAALARFILYLNRAAPADRGASRP